jgi:hypothetical protein
MGPKTDNRHTTKRMHEKCNTIATTSVYEEIERRNATTYISAKNNRFHILNVIILLSE